MRPLTRTTRVAALAVPLLLVTTAPGLPAAHAGPALPTSPSISAQDLAQVEYGATATSSARARQLVHSAPSARAAAARWLGATHAMALRAAARPTDSSTAFIGDPDSCSSGGGSGIGIIESASRPEISAKKKPGEVLSTLSPAGKMDGHPDVFDYRLASAGNSLSTGVTVRNGHTGKALWSRVSPTSKAHTLTILDAIPDRVGAAKKPGAIVVVSTIDLSENGGVTLAVSGVSGTGDTLWSKSFSGTDTEQGDTETETNLPFFDGTFHDRKGAGDDVLVDQESATFDESEDGDDSSSSTAQASVLSRVDGAMSPRGPLLTTANGSLDILAAPDLTGDGLDDIVDIASGDSGYVKAIRGDNGTPVWTSNHTPSDFAALSFVGQVSGGAAPDIAETDVTFGEESITESVSLLNGANGKKVWTHHGDCALAVGRAGKHHIRAVGVLRYPEFDDDSSSSTRPVFHYTAWSAASKAVLRKSISVDVPSSDDTSYDASFSVVGDVQPDTDEDLLVSVSASTDKLHLHVYETVDGRTGRIADVARNSLPADGSLKRGHGTDLVKLTSDHGLRLEGYDGKTGHRYYERAALPHTSHIKTGVAIGLRVTGHKCSDLSVSTDTNKVGILGLFSGSGKPLWTIKLPRGAVRGGIVTRHGKPASYCV